MNLNKLVMGGVAAAVLATANVSVANAGEIEANVALSTDYIFRGVTQTNNDPAISGGFDYSFDNGFYAGVWASNVDFGDDASTEIDLYGGYAVEVSEGVELDFGYIYYVYTGESSGLNYSEFTASISFDDLSFGLVYSPDYFGSDEDAIVFNVDYSTPIASNLNLDVHAGYIEADAADDVSVIFGEGIAETIDSYVEYSIGLSTTTAGVDLSLKYHGTDISSNIEDEIGAEDRIVFSIGKSF